MLAFLFTMGEAQRHMGRIPMVGAGSTVSPILITRVCRPYFLQDDPTINASTFYYV